MKKTENILQGGGGGIPGKFWNKKTHLEHFNAFWSIIKMVPEHTKKQKSVKKLKTLMPD